MSQETNNGPEIYDISWAGNYIDFCQKHGVSDKDIEAELLKVGYIDSNLAHDLINIHNAKQLAISIPPPKVLVLPMELIDHAQSLLNATQIKESKEPKLHIAEYIFPRPYREKQWNFARDDLRQDQAEAHQQVESQKDLFLFRIIFGWRWLCIIANGLYCCYVTNIVYSIISYLLRRPKL